MAKKDEDSVRCVVMGRDKPSQAWNSEFLIHITLRKSVAWRSAYAIQKQERAHGNTKYEAVVLSEEDFDAGRFKCRLKPPAGFDPEANGPPRVTELVTTEPPAPEPESKPTLSGAKGVTGPAKQSKDPAPVIGVSGPGKRSKGPAPVTGKAGKPAKPVKRPKVVSPKAAVTKAVEPPPLEEPAKLQETPAVQTEAEKMREAALNDLF